jgi:ABC-2 type transport system ATP-binding protein
VLTLERVGKRFGGRAVLENLSMEVGRGRVHGLVGANGAGKTTTMRITLGVLAADTGQVCWDGVPAAPEIRRHWGYMPEERGLYPKMRVGDQLVHLARLHGLEHRAARARAAGLLERLGVEGGPRARLETLSLGNQQRVQLAAALVHDPELLVLDEPFSGLDPVGVDVMAQTLRERVDQGAAVVFSSHQLELVERLCDVVGILKDGRMHASGTVAELRRNGRDTRYLVDVDTSADWTRPLTGVRVLRRDHRGTLVELPRDTDEQLLLDAARAAGRVRAFTPADPSLAELFRAVVADAPATTGDEVAA